MTTASNAAIIQAAIQRTLEKALEQESAFLSSGVRIIDTAGASETTRSHAKGAEGNRWFGVRVPPPAL